MNEFANSVKYFIITIILTSLNVLQRRKIGCEHCRSFSFMLIPYTPTRKSLLRSSTFLIFVSSSIPNNKTLKYKKIKIYCWSLFPYVFFSVLVDEKETLCWTPLVMFFTARRFLEFHKLYIFNVKFWVSGERTPGTRWECHLYFS